MKKKKSKHKHKHKPTCSYGHIFGQDGFDKKECDKCSLCESCGTATFNWDKEKREKRKAKLEKKKKRKPKSKKEDKATPRKQKKKHKKKQDYRGAYIPFPALNKLLKLTNHFCTKQYIFYLKTGIIQKTNQIWCNDNYAAKGLGWDKDTVRKAKNQLVKKGYITIIRKRDKQGRLGKSYIKLKYFPSKVVIEKAEYLRQLDEYERQLDEYAEEAAEWFGIFQTKINKLEVEAKKWKRKYKRLKKNT